MPDILQTLPIRAAAGRVFEAIATPTGLEAWWTLRSSGTPAPGAEYALWFGPEFDWRARVTEYAPGSAFELELVKADADWTGTRVGFRLEERDGSTWVRFAHVGWPGANEHYSTSTHCWALYLRLLRRYLEHGERVPYERRLLA
jgi:uncharacterized protein YndB with AHSA1/START domain